VSGGILAFENFNLKGILKKVKKNPERLFLGAADPFSSKMWGKVLGKDYDPMVDQMGGATQQTYKDAEAAGIDTTAGKGMHSLAHAIAAVYAGGYGAGQLGGAGAAGEGGLGAGADGVAESAGGGLGLDPGEGGAVLGDPGEGLSGGGGFSLKDLMRMQGGMGRQRQQQQPLRPDDYQEPDIGRYLQGATVPSSKRLKTPQGKGLADAVQRGLSGTDPIDANGVQVVAIKALDKRIQDLTKRAEALAARKGAQR
jgi:hypothetical protein